MKHKLFLNASKLRLGTIETRIESKTTNESSTDLYLHGDVGDSWWGEGITAKRVINTLNAIETPVVNVHLNTYGGDVFEGIAIHNLFRNSEKTINVTIDGIAASAGTIIALGANKIMMPSNTQFMIHNPWTYAAGNADDLEKVVKALRTTEESIIETYMQKFVGTSDELKQLLKDETFMTAKEAYELGFSDEILNQNESNDPEENMLNRLLNKYQSTPNEPQHPKPKNSANPLASFINLFEGGTK